MLRAERYRLAVEELLRLSCEAKDDLVINALIDAALHLATDLIRFVKESAA